MEQGTRSGPRLIDRTGQRYGKLVVIRRADNGTGLAGNARWLCRCDCGAEKVIKGTSLRVGKTKSCGCLKRVPKRGYLPGECARNRVLNGYRQGARSRGLSWDVTYEDFCRLITQHCFYCGSPPSAVSKAGPYSGEFIYNGIDRVDNTQGYVLDNMVTCCKICNHAKKDMSFDDFMAWIARLTKRMWFHPELLPSRLLKGGA